MYLRGNKDHGRIGGRALNIFSKVVMTLKESRRRSWCLRKSQRDLNQLIGWSEHAMRDARNRRNVTDVVQCAREVLRYATGCGTRTRNGHKSQTALKSRTLSGGVRATTAGQRNGLSRSDSSVCSHRVHLWRRSYLGVPVRCSFHAIVVDPGRSRSKRNVCSAWRL